MSKKHYEAVAAIIKAAFDCEISRKECRIAHRAVVMLIASKLASLFYKDNSRFDRHRFLKACGLTDE